MGGRERDREMETRNEADVKRKIINRKEKKIIKFKMGER